MHFCFIARIKEERFANFKKIQTREKRITGKSKF